MSAPPLPAATSGPAPVAVEPSVRSPWLLLSAGIVALWIVCLAALTWRTANPAVINQVQISSADLIFVGRWADRKAGRFEVERELKRQQLQGEVIIEGALPHGPPTSESWVIPVTVHREKYAVTQGVFINHPRQPAIAEKLPPWKVEVAPLCYPATEDILRQIDAALGRPQAGHNP